jgi:hypothetical protein
MQDFTHSYTPEELHMTLLRPAGSSLLFRDDTTGELEVWIPHAAGLLNVHGQRYGYSHDLPPAPHSVN